MKSIIISVINDLATDRRVQRIAGSMVQNGYQVHLVGRKFRNSLPFQNDAFSRRRFRMLVNKGPLFYAFYNIRLFFYLFIREKPLLLVSVDLDTLPANYLISRLKNIPLLYDSHEYFTEVPELVDRPRVKRIWERIEKMIVPKLKAAMTVSDAVASAYRDQYGVEFTTIRNVPRASVPAYFPEFKETYPSTYKLIYQGALNLGRGIELMIEAMQYLQDTSLLVIGDGDIRTDLQQLVYRLNLTDRIFFPGRIPPDQLIRITAQCDLGLSLEEDLGLNYRYALPNKIFDYIQARIPVLCSDLPEMAALVKKNGVGEICKDRSPQQLASQIRQLLLNEKKRDQLKVNLERAAKEHCWEQEEHRLLALIEDILKDQENQERK